MTETAQATEPAEETGKGKGKGAKERVSEPERTEGAGAAPAAAEPAGVGMISGMSLLVGVITFVVLLGVICAAFVFVVKKPAAETASAPKPEPAGEKGPLIYHTLIDNYTFATTLPPNGGTVTFQYGITVQIYKGDEEKLNGIIAARQLMPKLQADIRKIIAQEDYPKLRAQELENVSRLIKDQINADLGEKLVEGIEFQVWNVW